MPIADTIQCLTAADHWDRLADQEEAMSTWKRQRGLDLSAPGQSSGDRRAESYRRCAKSLRLEAETGIPHCACHLVPVTACPVRKKEVR